MMGFKESGQTHSIVISQINNLMASWLSINLKTHHSNGIIIYYPDHNGNIYTKELKDITNLEVLYKICNSNTINIFYLLRKVYNEQVKYSELIYCIDVISNKITKIQSLKELKVGKESENKCRQLSYEMRQEVIKARKTFHINP
ncbi:MAG: hypothetical protein ACO3UU_02720 [Minisyncoccia bacterium]